MNIRDIIPPWPPKHLGPIEEKKESTGHECYICSEPIEFGEWCDAENLGEGWHYAHEKCKQMAEDEDPTPWCSWCGAKTRSKCHCGPRADND